MTREYAERKIEEALKLTGGNALKARKQIIAWTFEDAKLLQALAQPHLTGIVAHAVSRVVRKKDSPDSLPDVPDMDDDPDAGFGFEILKTIVAGGSPRFGQESAAPPVRKQPASQRHIDAIRKLAGKKPSGKTEE